MWLGVLEPEKSSLTLALFRIIEADTGSVIIDDVKTSSVGLLDLRRRLAIIPQDAALFEGTIRDNLDPAGVHDDTELWTVLGMSLHSPICFQANTVDSLDYGRHGDDPQDGSTDR